MARAYKKREKEYAKSYKDNFWSRKRVEADITLRELADVLKIKPNTLDTYFTGCAMPKDEVIKAICDWFGVPEIEGRREFLKARKAYDAQKEGKRVVVTSYTGANKEKTTTEVSKKTVDEKENMNTSGATPMTKDEIFWEISKLVYGKIPNSVYHVLKSMTEDEINISIYDVVDYPTFKLIGQLLRGEITGVEERTTNIKF